MENFVMHTIMPTFLGLIVVVITISLTALTCMIVNELVKEIKNN